MYTEQWFTRPLYPIAGLAPLRTRQETSNTRTRDALTAAFSFPEPDFFGVSAMSGKRLLGPNRAKIIGCYPVTLGRDWLAAAVSRGERSRMGYD